MKRIFDDKIKRHKCPNCYGFLSAAANLYQSDACVPKFSENNICKIREIRSCVIRTNRTLASQNFRKIISVKSAKSVVKQLNINN